MRKFGKTTRYFRENVLKKRPYLKPEWIEEARRGNFVAKEIQSDGRIKIWIYIEYEKRYLRVVFLEDMETVHNAFFDRGFVRGKKNEI